MRDKRQHRGASPPTTDVVLVHAGGSGSATVEAGWIAQMEFGERAVEQVIGFAGVKSASLCPLVVAACLSGIMPACRERKPSNQTVAGDKADEHAALTRCRVDSGGKFSNDVDIDLRRDRENCGECGRLCAPNSTCLSGTCPSYSRLVTRSLNTCLVRDNGSIQCWSKLDERSPIMVHDIDGIGPSLEIQGDSMSICALSRSGHLNCWGENWGQAMKTPALAPIPDPAESGSHGQRAALPNRTLTANVPHVAPRDFEGYKAVGWDDGGEQSDPHGARAWDSPRNTRFDRRGRPWIGYVGMDGLSAFLACAVRAG